MYAHRVRVNVVKRVASRLDASYNRGIRFRRFPLRLSESRQKSGITETKRRRSQYGLLDERVPDQNFHEFLRHRDRHVRRNARRTGQQGIQRARPMHTLRSRIISL